MFEREADEAHDSQVTFVPSTSDRDGTLRWRRVLALAVSLLLGVALLLVLVRDYFPRSTQPAPPTGPTRANVQIVTNALSGAASVNGRQMTLPATFQPRTGVNEVRLITVPFSASICRFRWPRLTILTPTCSLLSKGTEGQDGQVATEPYTIEIPLGVASLSVPLREQALAALGGIVPRQARAEPLPVPVGARIAMTAPDGTVRTEVATVPLVAMLQQRIDPASAFPARGEVTLAAPQETTQGPLWFLVAQVVDTWRFTDRSGRTLGAATIVTTDTVTVTLRYTATAIQYVGFHLNGSDVDLGTVTAPMPETCSERPAPLARYLARFGDAGWVPVHEGGAQGCLMELTPPAPGTTTPGPAPVPARFLIRFGCLLAANDQAAVLIPGIPRATSSDIQAVEGARTPSPSQ